MTLINDHRDKRDPEDSDFEPDENDEEALKLRGDNPLKEEEKIEMDVEGND